MIRVVHPGSGSRIRIPDPDPDFLPIPDFGSRIQGSKRKRSRIRNTGLFWCSDLSELNCDSGPGIRIGIQAGRNGTQNRIEKF
jgi:hypothetical protein